MKRHKPDTIFSSTVKSAKKSPKEAEILKPNSAGIDIGSRSHFVAIPPDRCEGHVREFSTVTGSLLEMAEWLIDCGITTAAMESTGSYWIPCYEILEAKGIEVYLVPPEQVKSRPGRKTDVIDCQWIQKLHSLGFLTKSFRPKDHCLKLRALTRQHTTLIQHRSPHIQHMQKALQEMNIQLHTHIRDITGVTGSRIIDAILDGERDTEVFASLVHPTCKLSAKTIAESLKGNYRYEHLFSLRQARDLYRFYNEKIVECEREIQAALDELSMFLQNTHEQENQATAESDKVSEQSQTILGKPVPTKKCSKQKKKEKKPKKGISIEVEGLLTGIAGVNLTSIPGIDQITALKIISELGGNVDEWKSAKHFASWMGLCPGNKKSGGKQMSGKTKQCPNRVAQLLRMAVNGLWNAKCYLGAFLRRMRSKQGGMKAITCTAHKMARIIYNMIKTQTSYEELGEEYYEKTYRERRLKALQRQAAEMGLRLIQDPTES